MEGNCAMSVFRLVAKSTHVTSLVTYTGEHALLQFRGASPCEMYMPCNCFLQDFFVHLDAPTPSANLTLYWILAMYKTPKHCGLCMYMCICASWDY
jgi:hypothetical protein